MPRYLKFVVSIALPLIIGFIGGIATSSSVSTWYKGLVKPSFTPPNWLFGPAWTLLYILMGIAFYIVWMKNFGGKASLIITIFSLQLLANLLWSILFFGLKNPLLGLVDIVVLWILILINIVYFFRVSNAAGILLIPYILWVTFATALNAGVYILNK
ncbi:MAG: TspO/MBR family protein [Candidatus Hydrothermia bacterium]